MMSNQTITYLIEALESALNQGEGVVVGSKESPIVVANISGDISVIPLSEVSDDISQFSKGQWIQLQVNEEENE